MACTLKIPVPLRNLTDNQSEVKLEGKTVKEVVGSLTIKFPAIKERVCDENGNIRRFINVYLNEEDIRFLKNSDTEVKDGDEISLIPAIAGGSF
jgi:molybdopterin synthase sulfur carrier subunit